MPTEKFNPTDVDNYIKEFPEPGQKLLVQIRATIKKSAPDAKEVISYKMPAYKYFGMLVYFAMRKNHIGFYPYPSAIEAFKEELSNYEVSTGTVKFALDKPLPLDLIGQMVSFRVEENLKKAEAQKNNR